MTATWVMLILGALVLVFARAMQVEVIAAGNRLAAQRAAAVELGAEQYVMALAQAAGGDAALVCDVPLEAMPVGDGYFWVLRPDPENDQVPIYGVADEAGKLSLNSAARDDLLVLPGMTNEAADAIVDWRDEDSEVGEQGAESEYYSSLPEPYAAKDGPFETVEELVLVRGVTPEILYGSDPNRDGVIDDLERAGQGMAGAFNASTAAGRGILPYLTVYTVDPNTAADGTARVPMNAASTTQPSGGGGGGGGGSSGGGGGGGSGSGSGGSNDPLQALLREVLPQQRADDVFARARANGVGQFTNVFDFANKLSLTSDEFKLLADRLTHTTATKIPGLVNVNTAPREVLMCLPGMEPADADALVGARAGADTTSIAWVLDAVGPEKAAEIGRRITGRSYQYSADIVAVSGDGRAFKRVRIVVDVRSATPRIVYRRDLTDLGWPLAPEIRDSLRSGNGLQTITAGAGRSSTGGGVAR